MNKKTIRGAVLACALLAATATAYASEVVARSFVQAGANSVARSYADKLADLVNVKDKGAKCDGVTDDTAAIQAAVNGGGTVQLPSGVCIVTKITLPANTALVGQSDRSQLRRKPGVASAGPVLYASGVYQVTIANLTVDGNSAAAGVTGADSNIFVTGSYNVTIDRVRSVNSLSHGISMQSGTDKANGTVSTIRNSFIKTAKQYGIEAQDMARIMIEGNRVSKVDKHGILVYGTTANTIQGATIAGNVVTDAGGSGIAVPFVGNGPATAPGVEDVTISGNTVEASAENGYIVQARFATVTGNTAARNGSQNYHQGFVINVISVTVTGNTASRNAGVGIDFGDCKRVIASGNLVEENGIIGIEVNSTEDFSVTGNVVINNNQNGSAGDLGVGILVHLGTGGYTFAGNSVNGVIANNVVRSGPYQQFGIKATGFTGNIRLIGNDALGAGTVRDFEILTPSGQFVQVGNTTGTPTLTPAATVTIPQVGQFFYVAAGGTITSIVTDGGTYEIGRVIILKFNGAATVANGTGNIYLNGSSFAGANGSVLVLVRADGSSWVEMSRRP